MSNQTWRELPPTQKQVDALQCTGRDIPATRGETSDLIGRLLKSGELVKMVHGIPIIPNTNLTGLERMLARKSRQFDCEEGMNG